MVPLAFALWSSAFGQGELIPVLYTADGENVSPPLVWECSFEVGSFALICEDPDAPVGNWIHWVVYNIPDSVRSLEPGIPDLERFDNGMLHGINSWGELGYGGPAPPSGKHRYFFRLYALEGILHLEPGATAEELKLAIEGNTIDVAEYMGEYTRE